MDRHSAIVVRPGDAPLVEGPPTAGMDRRELLRNEGVWVGWVRTEPALAGGWHHHGDRAGEFVFNPANMVHREITDAAEHVEAFVIRVGAGPLNINVDGPDPEGDPATV